MSEKSLSNLLSSNQIINISQSHYEEGKSNFDDDMKSLSRSTTSTAPMTIRVTFYVTLTSSRLMLHQWIHPTAPSLSQPPPLPLCYQSTFLSSKSEIADFSDMKISFFIISSSAPHPTQWLAWISCDPNETFLFFVIISLTEFDNFLALFFTFHRLADEILENI